MTNATLQGRVSKLEAEVKTLKGALKMRSVTEKNRGWLRAEILKGLASGIGTPMKENYWNQKKTMINKAQKAKKLPKWLQASLKDVEEGRVHGPFNTVEELMASLNSPGK